MKKPRAMVSAAVLAVIVIGVCGFPLPHYICCDLHIQPRQAAGAYVEFPGKIQQIHVQPGDWVRAGHPLVTLENIDVNIELSRLLSELEQQQSKLGSLRQRAFDDPSAADSIAEVAESIVALEQQLARRQQHAAGLRIEAPAEGFVLAPPNTAPGAPERGQLPKWSGSPLEPRNLRALLNEGVMVCQLGDPTQLEAILAIDQGDVEFVHPGQIVDILLEPFPGQRFRSSLTQLSQLDMKVSPHSLSSKTGGGLVTRTDAGGRERPISTTYQALAPLDDELSGMFIGATGQARVHTGSQTLAQRAWRFVCKTFSFDV